MSKGLKIGLIAIVVLGVVVGLCVALRSFKNERSTKALNEGRQFGRTTDVAGCQTKMVEMTRGLKGASIEDILDVQLFFDGCLEEGKPAADFCTGVADPWSDILNDNKGKIAECAKIGLKDSSACMSIIEKKLDYCRARR